LLADADFFQWLEHSCQAVLAKEWTALVHLLGVSVKGKAEIVARDETETGDRMLLNLGHTFGHALEAWAGYSDKLLHGEAIAIGICLAFQLSEQLGYIGKDSVMRVQKHFADMGVPTRVGDIQSDSPPDADTLIGTMRQDKKVRRGALTLILARGIGEAFVTRDIDVATVSEFLSRALDQQR
jgi:3-dehydroquinate synthetase